MIKTLPRFFVCLLLSWSYIGSALADEFHPLLVKIVPSISSEQNTFYNVEMRVPFDRRIATLPTIELTKSCQQINRTVRQQSDRSAVVSSVHQCQQNLAGTELFIRYQPANPGLSTLLTVDLGEDNIINAALPAHQGSWRIPATADTSSVAMQYFGLGFKHLLTGFDHLLFVACLLFICLGRWGKLITTITAFTLAHSLTLGLNVFGLLALNTRAVEAVIALSIVYLAYDIVRHAKPVGKVLPKPRSLSYQYPELVAGGFGLLHGLGFANILNQYGLPADAKMWALLSFNIGIEVGQLAFVALLLIVAWISRRIFGLSDVQKGVSTAATVGGYFIGITAMFWTWQRVLGVF